MDELQREMNQPEAPEEEKKVPKNGGFQAQNAQP